MRTAAYYQPILKDGVNINPDMNITTTEAHCGECHYDFKIKEQGDKVWVEEGKYNPPKPPLEVNITAGAYESKPIEYVPDEDYMHTSVAHIDNNGHPSREKTQLEKQVENLRERVVDLEDKVNELMELHQWR